LDVTGQASAPDVGLTKAASVTVSDSIPEDGRRAALVAAEKRAEKLFDEIEQRGLLRPGRTEREIEQDIYAIALEQFGVEKHWHKRIVRAGVNTLTIAAENPPVRTIAADDIVYVDLGPVFEDWEADLGRTYILGNHPGSPLVAALPVIFEQVQAHYHATPDIRIIRLRLSRGRRRRVEVRRGDRGTFGQRVRACPHSRRQGFHANPAGEYQAYA
jgi:hypothetical protein